MMRLLFAFVPFLFLAGCGKKDATPTGGGDPGQAADAKTTLPEARKGFATKTTGEKANRPVAEPPAKVFRKVKYDSPAGKLAAYLTPSPGDGKKRPAIIWITGGDCNSIDDVWSPPDPRSPGDESARQYREAGIVMMFPSLRGGNDNPGVKEGFYGEVDDVIAAADFLAKQDYVDSKRLYLGGHSTGGTLVMLVAASTDKFRAVFSFGPAEDVFFYPQPYVPFDRGNRRVPDVRVRGHRGREPGLAAGDGPRLDQPEGALLPGEGGDPLQPPRAGQPLPGAEDSEGRRRADEPRVHRGRGEPGGGEVTDACSNTSRPPSPFVEVGASPDSAPASIAKIASGQKTRRSGCGRAGLN
jgi:acetyl esterase/lipase